MSIILDLPLTAKNNPKRFMMLRVCPICGEDVDIMDVVPKSVVYNGVKTHIAVCPNCLTKKDCDNVLIEKIRRYAKPGDLW